MSFSDGINPDWPALEAATQQGTDDIDNQRNDIEATAQGYGDPTSGPDPGASGSGSGPSAYDQQNMLAGANATNNSAGQPNPGDIAAASGLSINNDPDSYTQQRMLQAAQATAAQAGQPYPSEKGIVNTTSIPGDYKTGLLQGETSPGVPNVTSPSLPLATAPGSSMPGASTAGYVQPLLGGTPVTGPQLPGASSGDLSADQRLVRDAAGNVVGVRSANGYYDPNFQSTSNMLNNYQQGDRMAGTTDALNILAQMGNGNAKAVLGAEKATGSNVMGSQLEANWAQRHNAQIQGDLTGGAFQGNQAAQQNLKGQEVQVNATPTSNAESFPMAQRMMDDLAQVKGVSNVSLDNYGNVVFSDEQQKSANNLSGMAHIPMNEWADWYPVIVDRLSKQNAPAPAAPAATGGGGGGGGGYPPRASSAPRGNSGGGGGNGGGNTPPPLSGNPDADALAAKRLAEFFPTPESKKGVPASVGSAVAYAPGIYPGGFSPYDDSNISSAGSSNRK